MELILDGQVKASIDQVGGVARAARWVALTCAWFLASGDGCAVYDRDGRANVVARVAGAPGGSDLKGAPHAAVALRVVGVGVGAQEQHRGCCHALYNLVHAWLWLAAR